MSVRRRYHAAMGGGTLFTPNSITGIQGWWRADAITGLVDGNLIDSTLSRYWPDSSLNARDLQEPSAPPTYKTNIINSLPAVRFIRASTNRMVIKTGQPALAGDTKPITFVVVFSLNSNPAAVMNIFGTTVNATSGVTLNFSTALVPRLQVNNTAITPGGATAVVGTWEIFVATYSATGDYAYYTNGTAGNSGNNNIAPTSGSDRRFGGTGAGGTTQNLDADVAEMIQYDNVISAGDRSSLTHYLGTKYNITVV